MFQPRSQLSLTMGVFCLVVFFPLLVICFFEMARYTILNDANSSPRDLVFFVQLFGPYILKYEVLRQSFFEHAFGYTAIILFGYASILLALRKGIQWYYDKVVGRLMGYKSKNPNYSFEPIKFVPEAILHTILGNTKNEGSQLFKNQKGH